LDQERQIAAIVFTDIVGYTKLMGQSETRAFEAIQKNRLIQKPLIEKYGGVFVKELGDGTMARFQKASDAVRCAMEIQKATAQEPDLNLRIGIHLGEVIIENQDVFGDGVNIASRIESSAKAGAIYISSAVNGMVHNFDGIQTRFVDRMDLKNVNRPIDIYEVAIDGAFAEENSNPKKEKKTIPFFRPILAGLFIVALISLGIWWALGTEPSDEKREYASIAVLPFTNMSTSQENEFFCDGVTEDLLTHLSKLKNLKVISRTSVMHFKGSELTIPEIAKKLNVEYVVEGSVRRQGNRVAITAQLIKAEDDGHLWAENYQRELKDVFAIQREVAQEITEALNISISGAEKSNLQKSPTESVEAYQLFLKARESANKRTRNGILTAIDQLYQALKIDPDYADAYAELAHQHLLGIYYLGMNRDSTNSIVIQNLEQALEKDPTNLIAHIAYAGFYRQKVQGLKQSEYAPKMLKYASEALELDPNSARAHYKYAQCLAYHPTMNGDEIKRESLKHYRIASDLDPYSNVIVHGLLWALCENSLYDEAWLELMDRQNVLSENGFLINKMNIAAGLKRWKDLSDAAWTRIKRFPDNQAVAYWSIKYLLALAPSESERRSIIAEAKRRGVEFNVGSWYRLCFEAFLINEADSIRRTQNFVAETDEEYQKIAQADSYYLTRKFNQAQDLYNQYSPNDPNLHYCWTQTGQKERALDSLKTGNISLPYHRAFVFAGLENADSAVYYLEKSDWNRVAQSRYDLDMKPIWSSDQYKALISTYNFPDSIPTTP